MEFFVNLWDLEFVQISGNLIVESVYNRFFLQYNTWRTWLDYSAYVRVMSRSFYRKIPCNLTLEWYRPNQTSKAKVPRLERSEKLWRTILDAQPDLAIPLDYDHFSLFCFQIGQTHHHLERKQRCIYFPSQSYSSWAANLIASDVYW